MEDKNPIAIVGASKSDNLALEHDTMTLPLRLGGLWRVLRFH